MCEEAFRGTPLRWAFDPGVAGRRRRQIDLGGRSQNLGEDGSERVGPDLVALYREVEAVDRHTREEAPFRIRKPWRLG